MSEYSDIDRTGRWRMHNEWVVRDGKGLGRAIVGLRHERGLDQAELAERCGIHRSYLSNLERGHATVQTDRMFRVLRRLGVEIVVRARERDDAG